MWMILLSLLVPLFDALPSCLHLRSNCLRNPTCARYFQSFENSCGYSLTRCSIDSPSNCVKDLRAIRELLGQSSCVCYRALGYIEECDFFRQLLWNHPCERLLLDAAEERAFSERDLVTPLPSPGSRRSTRTPMADRVQELVQQLNGELQTKTKLERGTCNEALDQVCLRHVSCRQLWRLFRSSCGVDQDNKCTMTDREVCWQSFEGLSWTGLGNCHCDTTNPDCHWIRLLTNYNKCIYEISLTKTGSYQQERDMRAEDYRRRFESSYEEQKREEVVRQQQQQRIQQQQQERQTNHERSMAQEHERQRTLVPEQQYTQQEGPGRGGHNPGDRGQYSRPEDRQQAGQVHHETGKITQQDNYNRQSSTHQWSPHSQGQSHNRQQERNDYYGHHQQMNQDQNRIWQGRPDYQPQSERINEYYQNRYETPRSQEDQKNRVWNVQQQRTGPPTTTSTTTTTTTMTPTTTTTPVPTTTTTPRVQMTQRPWTTAMTVVRAPQRGGLRASVKERPESWKEDDPYYRPLFNMPPTPPPGYYRYSTSQPSSDREMKYEVAPTPRSYARATMATTPAPTQGSPATFPTLSPFTRESSSVFLCLGLGRQEPNLRALGAVPFSHLEDVDYEDGAAMLGARTARLFLSVLLLLLFLLVHQTSGSTCPDAVGRCEAADECRWHLGELKARCSRSQCRRDDCASALQRFARYVPPANAESVMFCQCSQEDTACQKLQELFYPSCLYTSAAVLPSCSQTAQRCNSDARCRALQEQLLSSCPLANGECAGRSLSDCRRVLLAARGSILEQPCFCPLNDLGCIAEQRQMIPSHPCIEKTMRDLSLNEQPPVPQTTVSVPGGTPSLRTEEKVIRAGSAAAVGAGIMGAAFEKAKEQHKSKYKGRTAGTTTTTTTTTTTNSPLIISSPRNNSRSKHKTTMEPPPPTEAPPPWETTTMMVVTTTEEYITAPPPPAEGCRARDANGRTVFFPMGTVMRRYVDWSGRCSSWCECTAIDQLSCERLPCLEDGVCEAPLTTIEFGERIFLKNRGACYCESSQFICELPDEMPELYPGLYVTAGYSSSDVEMLRKEVPSMQMEKAGLMSAEPAKDIGSRLQIAFERLQPNSLQCRLVLMSELSDAGYAFFRVEWWGMDERFNHTKTQWQHDGSEKVCSPSVTRLADLFANSDSLRYQLVLSTVKQVKVIDYLDGIPSSPASLLSISLLLPLVLLWSQVPPRAL